MKPIQLLKSELKLGRLYLEEVPEEVNGTLEGHFNLTFYADGERGKRPRPVVIRIDGPYETAREVFGACEVMLRTLGVGGAK